MSRISNFSSNTTLVNQLLRTQGRLFDLETQVSSQKKSQDYLGVSVNSQRLLNLENTKSQLDRFINNNTQQSVRLSIEETVIDGLQTAVKDFKQILANYETGNERDQEAVTLVQSQAQQALLNIQNFLNTDVAGRFIFSGSRVTNEPVEFGVNTLSTFQALYDGVNVTVPTTRDAHLERFSYTQDENNKAAEFVDPTNFLSFAQDADGNAATGGNGSITATSALFSNVAVGATITVADTTSNDGTYTVSSISSDGRTVEVQTTMLTDEANALLTNIGYRDSTSPTEELSIDSSDYGDLTFDRAANTIVASTADGLTNLAVGARFTVTGTSLNDGDFTVISNDGTTVTVASNKLTDEGIGSGNTFFDSFAGSQVVFTDNGTGTDTIAVEQFGGAGAVPDVFNGLAVGDTVTLTNTASNNITFTINAISADGSTITVDEGVTNETDLNTNFSGSNSFSYDAGTQLAFTGSTKSIVMEDLSGTAIPGAFSALQVGMSITTTGTTSNNGTFTIATVSSDGSSVTVTETITDEDDVNGARVQSFAASGNISATPYYSGDSSSTSHRTSELRSFDTGLTGIDPAFEKAIRAMKIILQGEFGSDGGLDENPERIAQAQYLLESSLELTVSGTPPFGTELTSNIQQLQQNNGFNQVLLNDQNDLHKDFIGFIDSAVADIENSDPLEAITRLLDDSRALEASYQTFSRIRQLSLVNFL
ncbi:hypothetical protein OAA86_05580 [Rhodospirillales bacterium]|jgi:flagellin-like hook-associated protein FlgL|nr:hypothetical protein [Rhodospirillales bacterium]